MARGYSQSRSEQPPSLERRANQAIRNAPEDAEYLDGLTPFDSFWESKNEDNLFDVVSDYLNNFDVFDAEYKNKNDAPAYAAFKKQVANALNDAKSGGSELVTRGGPTNGYEQDEVWSGEGNSGKYKTVLKAKGAPAVEITWHVYAYTDEDERGSSFKAELSLDKLKIL